jgi:hypothetical protein
MAYLLRTLLIVMISGITLTILTAMGHTPLSLTHVQVAIPSFLYLIFAQAFVMFYFIGSSRLADNVVNVLNSPAHLDEIFEKAPESLDPYKKKANQFQYDASLCKRKTIPWTMMMLALGMLAFFLGAAHDTSMVNKSVHVGVVYGFLAAMVIGIVKQWYYLGKTHMMLRKIKYLFELPDHQM